jgi:exopolysaccharide biosynthesis polyprenyl glycosylphosphotransferase
MDFFFANPIKKKQYLLLLFDSVIVISVFLCAYFIKISLYDGTGFETVSEKIVWLVCGTVFFHLIFFYIFELYDIEDRRPAAYNLLLLTISVFLAFGLFALLSIAFYRERIGMTILRIYVPLVIPVIFLWRRCFYSFCLKAPPQENLLVIGSDFSFDDIHKLFRDNSVVNYKLVDIISSYSSDNGFVSKKGAKYQMDLVSFVKNCNIHTIVTDERLRRSPELKKQLMALRVKGIRIYDFVKFYEFLSRKVPVAYQGEDCLIFSNQGKPFNPSFYLKVKRLLDFFFALLGIIIFLPLFIIIPIIIKLTSPGPVLFRQQRLGLNEKPFTLLKFRTMIDGAEKDTGPRWTSSNDTRVTKIGKYLRKTHLDEIPQIFNILEGSMSFVGPRPFRKYFIDLLSEKFPYYRLRLTAKPGLSGWAQVRGKNVRTEANQIENLEYDLFYIQHRSNLLDLHILIKTIQTVLFGKGE